MGSEHCLAQPKHAWGSEKEMTDAANVHTPSSWDNCLFIKNSIQRLHFTAESLTPKNDPDHAAKCHAVLIYSWMAVFKAVLRQRK